MMSKKIFSVILTIAMLAALFCVGTVAASADDTQLHAGDQVIYRTYATGETIGSIQTEVTYNADYITYVSGTVAKDLIGEGISMINKETDGIVHCGIVCDPYTGSNFNNDQVIELVFDVTADCTYSQLNLNSNVVDFTDLDAVPVTPHGLTFGYDVVCTHDTTDTDTATDTDTTTDSDSDTDTATDTDTVTDTDTTTDTASDTDTATDTASDTDTTTDTDTTKPTDTDKPSDSDKTSDSDKASDSDKKQTPDSSSRTSSTTSRTTSTAKTTTASTVQTAGTIAVISLVVILMAAGAVVLFSKKKAEQD